MLSCLLTALVGAAERLAWRIDDAERTAGPEAAGRRDRSRDHGRQNCDRRDRRDIEDAIGQGPVWEGRGKGARGKTDEGRALDNCEEGGWREVAMKLPFPYQPLVGFRSEKAAQVAALFLKKSGRHLEKMALIKLIYLAERESIRQRNRPIIYDEYYSLKDGPICSNALNAINGKIDQDIWRNYLELQGDRDVFVAPNCPDDFDEISISDSRILESVFAEFGGMSSAQLRAWTHKPANCPEYSDVNGVGRIPISVEDIVRAVGTAHPRDIAKGIHGYRTLERVLPRK